MQLCVKGKGRKRNWLACGRGQPPSIWCLCCQSPWKKSQSLCFTGLPLRLGWCRRCSCTVNLLERIAGIENVKKTPYGSVSDTNKENWVVKAFLSYCWVYIWTPCAFSRVDDGRQSSLCRAFCGSPLGLVYVAQLGGQRSDCVEDVNLEQLRWL